MAWRVRGGELPLSRTLVDPELLYGQISTTQKPFLRRNAHSKDVVQRMVPVAGRPIIMCGTSGCSGSCSLSAVEIGYEAGKKPATCQTCGEDFPRTRTVGTALLSRLDVAETPHLPCLVSQVWLSWSDSPRDQAVPKSVEAVMEDCTESHQTWNEMLGELSRSRVGTALTAAVGPSAPSEPVPHSSGFVATSVHAATSGLSAGSFAPVQSISRVDCAVTHGFGGVESVPRSSARPASRYFPLLVSRSQVNMP